MTRPTIRGKPAPRAFRGALCTLLAFIAIAIPGHPHSHADRIDLTFLFSRGGRIELFRNGSVTTLPIPRAISNGSTPFLSGLSPLRYSWSRDGRYFLVSPRFAVASEQPASLVFSATGQLLHTLRDARTPGIWDGPYWMASGDQLAYAGVDLRADPLIASIWTLAPGGVGRLTWPSQVGQLKGSGAEAIEGPLKSPDPALRLTSTDMLDAEIPLVWIGRSGLYLSDLARSWYRITAAGKPHIRPLDFDTYSQVSQSGGLITGVVGARPGFPFGRVVISHAGGQHSSRTVGYGSDPVWSSDGKWLYFVTRHRIRTIVLRKPQFNGSGQRQRGRVTSEVYEVTVTRVRRDGVGREVVTKQKGYDITDMTVLPQRGEVLFELIPSDLRLARANRGRLSGGLFRSLVPKPRIEYAFAGHSPKVLLDDVSVPASAP